MMLSLSIGKRYCGTEHHPFENVKQLYLFLFLLTFMSLILIMFFYRPITDVAFLYYKSQNIHIHVVKSQEYELGL